MSWSPNALGVKDATGAVPSTPSSHATPIHSENADTALLSAPVANWHCFACVGSSPQGRNPVDPALAAYSHSASLGKR